MKFLCIDCDEQMTLAGRKEPGDGTFTWSFVCPTCAQKVALLANPAESQLVAALGVKIGGRSLDEQEMELIRSSIVGREDAFVDASRSRPASVRWSPASEERLSQAPTFVRSMIKRAYHEWAEERGITEITPVVMDEARADLGLEDMSMAEPGGP